MSGASTSHFQQPTQPPTSPSNPNWVEVGTLCLAILGAVGATAKFYTIESKLGTVQTELAEIQVVRSKEQLLQVTGNITESPFSAYWIPRGQDEGASVRRAALSIELKNIGDAPLRIDHVDVTVSRKEMDVGWANILKQPPVTIAAAPAPALAAPAPAAPAPASPTPVDVTTLESTTLPEAKPEHLRLGMLDGYAAEKGGWSDLHTWKYDPKVHAGSQAAGIILRGQARSLTLDFLLDDSANPELLRFEVIAYPAAEGSSPSPGKQIWVGWLGCGPLRALFAPLNGPYPAAPAPAAPGPSPPLNVDVAPPPAGDAFD